MDFDAARLEKDGVEAHLQVALADAPEWCGEGFRLVRREWPTDIGPVDLMCRDARRRLDRGGDQADRDDRRGRAALPLPGADPARSRAGRLPRRARGDDRQAAGARARGGARDRVGRGRPRGAARRARAGADACSHERHHARTRDGVLVDHDRPARRRATRSTARWPRGSRPRSTGSTPTLRSRSGVLTGAGGYFSAGMDLKAFAARAAVDAGGRGFAGIVQRPPDTPLIAAIEGFAVAGGFEVALACDLIVAARGAKLGIPEVKRSLVAAGGALLRLPRRIPYHVAMELALTGDPISAERGHELGLVNRLAEPGGALDAALELAAAIAPNGPLALAATKRDPGASRPAGRRTRSGRASRRSPARCSPRRTRARAPSRSPRSARPSGAAARPTAATRARDRLLAAPEQEQQIVTPLSLNRRSTDAERADDRDRAVRLPSSARARSSALSPLESEEVQIAEVDRRTRPRCRGSRASSASVSPGTHATSASPPGRRRGRRPGSRSTISKTRRCRSARSPLVIMGLPPLGARGGTHGWSRRRGDVRVPTCAMPGTTGPWGRSSASSTPIPISPICSTKEVARARRDAFTRVQRLSRGSGTAASRRCPRAPPRLPDRRRAAQPDGRGHGPPAAWSWWATAT